MDKTISVAEPEVDRRKLRRQVNTLNMHIRDLKDNDILTADLADWSPLRIAVKAFSLSQTLTNAAALANDIINDTMPEEGN